MRSKNISATMLAITFGMLVLFFLFHWQWCLAAAVIVSAIGLFSPALSNWIDWLWNKVALVLGYVNGRILLTLVFFVVLTPVALLSRLFGKGVVMKKAGKDSCFTERNHTYTKADLENPW